MTIARNAGTFFGTSESSGVTIANNATQTGSEVDQWGNNASEGYLSLLQWYFTSTVTAGSMDGTLFYARTTGNEAEDQSVLTFSYPPANASQKINVGQQPATRYMIGQVKNNATGASITNGTLGYEATQES